MSQLCEKRFPLLRGRGARITYWILILSVPAFFPFPALSDPRTLPSFLDTSASISILQVDPAVQFAEAKRSPETPIVEEPLKDIADPLEPVNRLFFGVNDKVYFWVLKPVASGYKTVIAQPIRVSVRNFFSNAATPIRFANCLLQFKLKGAGTEGVRFFINTTIGVLGFYDLAKKRFNINEQDEDFGQTLGFYGIGPIFYIDWPIFGPSSLRDVVGTVGDFFLSPWNYLFESPVLVNVAVGAYERVNNVSLTLGEYEDLKRAALDPYIALRDAYHQFRQEKISE